MVSLPRGDLYCKFFLCSHFSEYLWPGLKYHVTFPPFPLGPQPGHAWVGQSNPCQAFPTPHAQVFIANQSLPGSITFPGGYFTTIWRPSRCLNVNWNPHSASTSPILWVICKSLPSLWNTYEWKHCFLIPLPQLHSLPLNLLFHMPTPKLHRKSKSTNQCSLQDFFFFFYTMKCTKQHQYNLVVIKSKGLNAAFLQMLLLNVRIKLQKYFSHIFPRLEKKNRYLLKCIQNKLKPHSLHFTDWILPVPRSSTQRQEQKDRICRPSDSRSLGDVLFSLKFADESHLSKALLFTIFVLFPV